MKKYIIPLLAGIVVSYCFASMVLNARIINPVAAFQNKPLILSWDELLSGTKDLEIVSENRLRSASNDSWIEIKNVRERIGRLRSVTYKVKPIDTEDEIKTVLHYADTEQDYHSFRSLTTVFNGGSTVIEIPDYAGPIDKIRFDLTSLNDITLDVDELSLNTDSLFSAPMMVFIYGLWCLLAFLEPRIGKH